MDDPNFVFQPLEAEVEMPYSARLKQCKRSRNIGPFVGVIAVCVAGLIYWQVSNSSDSKTKLPANRGVAESPVAIPKEGHAALAVRHQAQPLEPVDHESSLSPDAATAPLVDSDKLEMQEAPEATAGQDSSAAPLTDPDAEKTLVPTQKSPETPSKVKEKNPKKANQQSPGQNETELFGPPFGANPLADNEPDPDQQSWGIAKLAELVRQAREANTECTSIERDCRPLVTERSNLMVAATQKQLVAAAADIQVKNLDAQLNVLKQRVRFSNVGLLLNAQEDKLRAERDGYARTRDTNNAEAENHVARLAQLKETLQYSFIKFKRRWDELNDCRKRWLEICRPHDKYARADFEGARRVTDEWLQVDNLWMDAYCWSALCAYELGEFLPAKERIETAEKLRTEVLRQVRPIRLIEAMQGLIAIQLPAQRSKSASIVQKAMTNVDKDDWQTPFVAGRAAVELGRQDSRAKAFFERTLKINPDCQYAKYWLGHLQTTSTETRVRDLDAGIAMLESTWSFSGMQSWRIGVALARAYDAAGREPAASRQWKSTLELVPVSERSKLKLK
jgi:hypothetical protein